MERQVAALVKNQMLSTAELILCLEKGVRPLKDVNQLIDCIYEKEEAECESIITDCRVCDFRFPVLAAISNLYFKQRIMFQIL